jgi:hypothetical protein
MSDEDRNAYHLLLGAMQISDARARTGARGVPDEVVDATLSDLAVWSQRFEELASSEGESFGGLTLEVLSWCQRFLHGELVRLGPIQFDLRPFPAPMRVLRHDKTRQLRARTLDGRTLDLRTGRVTDEVAPPLDSRWQIVLEPGTPMLEIWFRVRSRASRSRTWAQRSVARTRSSRSCRPRPCRPASTARAGASTRSSAGSSPTMSASTTSAA